MNNCTHHTIKKTYPAELHAFTTFPDPCGTCQACIDTRKTQVDLMPVAVRIAAGEDEARAANLL